MDGFDSPSGRPEPGEFAEYARDDIELVHGEDAVEALLRQRHETVTLFERFGERYLPLVSR